MGRYSRQIKLDEKKPVVALPLLSTVCTLGVVLFFTAASAYGQTPEPTLAQTLGWIQDSLNDGYGDNTIQTAQEYELRALRLAKFSGCQVTFVVHPTNLDSQGL